MSSQSAQASLNPGQYTLIYCINALELSILTAELPKDVNFAILFSPIDQLKSIYKLKNSLSTIHGVLLPQSLVRFIQKHLNPFLMKYHNSLFTHGGYKHFAIPRHIPLTPEEDFNEDMILLRKAASELLQKLKEELTDETE